MIKLMRVPYDTIKNKQFNRMKMHTLQKVYESLRDEKFEIHLGEALIADAVKPIRRMLELSA